MTDAISGVFESVDSLENPKKLINVRAIAQEFVQKRLSNTRTAEDVKKAALDKLNTILTNPDSGVKFGPTLLLEVINTLNDSTKDDFLAMIKSQNEKASSGNNYFSVFMGETPNRPQVTASSEMYALMDKLVSAADSVISEAAES